MLLWDTTVIEIVHDVAQNMQAQQQTDVCVLDFSKGSDKVGYRRLAYKLLWYGSSGSTNEWIKDFLFQLHSSAFWPVIFVADNAWLLSAHT